MVTMVLVSAMVGGSPPDTGLTVAVSPGLPSGSCTPALGRLKALLTTASALLAEETGVPLAKVTLLLPPSWRHTACTASLPLAAPTAARPDVWVTPRDPVFGARPYSVQHAGCGAPGAGVRLPMDSLVRAEGGDGDRALGRQFTSALLSHMHGVFPTHGFQNDSRYPAAYSVGEVVLESQGCSVNTKLLCSPAHYDPAAPTKQNLLCAAQPPLTVVQGEARVRGNSTLTGTQPVFQYVIQERVRYVLVLDRGARLEEGNRWTNLHNALHRFVMSLPTGAELAVVTYEQEARLNLEPTVLTPSNRAGLHGRIPGRPGSAAQSCPECGLTAAAGLLSSAGRTTLPVVVLVTGSPSATPALATALAGLAARQVPVFTISLGGPLIQPGASLLPPGARLTVVPDDQEGEAMLTRLSDALAAVTTAVEGPDRRALQFLHRGLEGRPGHQLDGKFTVEESLRTRLRVELTTGLKEDVEAFSLVSPSGHQHKFPVVERGSLYFEMVGEAETGIWTYSVRLTTSTSAPVLGLTLTGAATRTGPGTVELRAWPEAGGVSGPAITGPVLIYAELRQAGLPVSQAEVVATVHVPGGGAVEVVLGDEGTGYPDITAGDGIYSGYFTALGPEPGYYTVTVQAADSGSARVPSPSGGAGQADCCGSRFPALATIPTPSFSRVVTAPSFAVTTAVQYFLRGGVPRMQDIFPPARVSDLRLAPAPSANSSSLEALLVWTAPGGDLASGQAATYEVRCYTDRESLAEQTFREAGIPVHAGAVPRPGPAGMHETATVTLPWANEVFYYGLVATDEAGNRSPVSNLVPVFAVEVATAAPQAELRHGNLSAASLPSTVLEAFEDNLMVYIISGCITGIALIILLVIVISLRISRRKAQQPKRDLIKEISSPTLIHSSAALPGILKDPSHLSVLPHRGSPGEYSLDYSVYPAPGEDVSWAILPTYTNSAFQKHSTDTLVDSGFYRAGEAVDNVSEFYRPASDYVTYQNLGLAKEEEGGGTETTSSTDCEHSETCSDKAVLPRAFKDSIAGSKVATGEFHSLIVTGEGWSPGSHYRGGEDLVVSGPISLPGALSEYDIQEKRRRRESFV